MPQLKELLNEYQKSALSFDELLTQLKSETTHADSSQRLLERLIIHQTEQPLPEKDFENLKSYILGEYNLDDTEMNAQTIHAFDSDATQLNTSFRDVSSGNEETQIIADATVINNDATRLDTEHSLPQSTYHDSQHNTAIPDVNDKTTLDARHQEPMFAEATQIEPHIDETRIAPDAQTRLDRDATFLAGIADSSEYATTMFNTDTIEHIGKTSSATQKIIKQRFILEDIIGQGGMGTVYRARDLRKEEAEDRNPYVALKIMNDDFKRHPDAFKAMQRETQKSQNLAHPNIITVFDFDRDDDAVYMTMELLEGQTLKDFIREHPAGIAKDEAKNIVEGISQALAYAHKNDIVHSDLKPGNVFIGNDGKVKVLDFGIARAVPRHDDDPEHAADFDAGSLGALTPSYASLEMIEREPPHPSDDIYALGVITYELLTGQHPYKRLSADKVAVQGLKPEQLTTLKRREWNSLNKSLAVPRDERIQNIEEFIADFIQPRSIKGTIITSTLIIALLASTAAFIFKPATELPPSVQELSEQQVADIANMLDTASLYMTIGQLASPPGDSALDLYN
ncbi:MAG: serine/threonine protein kinase, partial [Gammaproteobacteria bacterium]|nr:serine/threonine protein kinase [Gammaproteobacteria bacterium]